MANDPVVAQLRPDQVQEITTAFMEFDVSRNGFITAGEMKQCLRQANIQYQDAEVDRVISNMDLNHDGNASYDEYMKFMARVYTGKHDLFYWLDEDIVSFLLHYQQPPPASNYPPPQGQQYSQQPSNYPPRNY
ncbi:unnamed protein product [Rotaria socialis]|uniref:EF-hand domain-containing protein n=1 Tax=Rotaria socialis TaxID=392032 RepID=A0A820TJ55_9BILA|nr:unnamed protein product [Rotaria socialis]